MILTIGVGCLAAGFLAGFLSAGEVFTVAVVLRFAAGAVARLATEAFERFATDAFVCFAVDAFVCLVVDALPRLLSLVFGTATGLDTSKSLFEERRFVRDVWRRGVSFRLRILDELLFLAGIWSARSTRSSDIETSADNFGLAVALIDLVAENINGNEYWRKPESIELVSSRTESWNLLMAVHFLIGLRFLWKNAHRESFSSSLGRTVNV